MNNEIERMKKYILIYKNEFQGKINIKDDVKLGVEIEFTTYNHKPIKSILKIQDMISFVMVQEWLFLKLLVLFYIIKKKIG